MTVNCHYFGGKPFRVYLLIVLGLKDTIDEIQRDIGQRMYETCLRGNLPDAKDLLSRDDMVKLKRCIFAQGKR